MSHIKESAGAFGQYALTCGGGDDWSGEPVIDTMAFAIAARPLGHLAKTQAGRLSPVRRGACIGAGLAALVSR
ncbi:hypothetical protein [Rhizobium sp. BK251]|uniref:hypothetical protein n=1 Tax=Rhizobium sp. BK251 TaxID=2512125 RepID=UPI00105319E8|nr:hypothetical protein [Rhizobium sp. BK251]